MKAAADRANNTVIEAATRDTSTAASADDVGTPETSGAAASVLASFDELQQQPSGSHWFSDSFLGKAWRGYNSSLESNPVRTKASTSFIGFVLGDIMAQKIGGVSFVDPVRCLRLGTYGLAVDGPFGHLWYKILDRTVEPKNPQGLKAVLVKTAADQLIWAPIMTCVFFAVLKTLEGHPELIMSTIEDKLVKTIVANYILWPAAHFINFRFVPSEQRIAYNNVVSVAWNAYLSTLSHNAALDTTALLGVLDQASALLDGWVPDEVTDGLAGLGTALGGGKALEGMRFDIPKSIDLRPTRTLLDWLPLMGEEKGI